MNKYKFILSLFMLGLAINFNYLKGQQLILNGRFEANNCLQNGDGCPHIAECVDHWRVDHGTPQLKFQMCDVEPNDINHFMFTIANRTGGEGFYQEVNLTPGTYSFAVYVKTSHHPGAATQSNHDGLVRVSLGNSSPGPDGCQGSPFQGFNLLAIPSSQLIANNFTLISVDFTLLPGLFFNRIILWIDDNDQLRDSEHVSANWDCAALFKLNDTGKCLPDIYFTTPGLLISPGEYKATNGIYMQNSNPPSGFINTFPLGSFTFTAGREIEMAPGFNNSVNNISPATYDIKPCVSNPEPAGFAISPSCPEYPGCLSGIIRIDEGGYENAMDPEKILDSLYRVGELPRKPVENKDGIAFPTLLQLNEEQQVELWISEMNFVIKDIYLSHTLGKTSLNLTNKASIQKTNHESMVVKVDIPPLHSPGMYILSLVTSGKVYSFSLVVIE